MGRVGFRNKGSMGRGRGGAGVRPMGRVGFRNKGSMGRGGGGAV